MVAGSMVPGLLPLPFMLGVMQLSWMLPWDFGWGAVVGGQEVWVSLGHPCSLTQHWLPRLQRELQISCISWTQSCGKRSQWDGEGSLGDAESQEKCFPAALPQGHFFSCPCQVCPQHPHGYGSTTSILWLMLAVDNPPSQLNLTLNAP